MKDLSEDLKQTEELSTDAETVAHDALASIDARHQVIKDSIVTGRTLLDDNTAIKMAMEATEKALVDLKKERPKRDADPGNLLRGNNNWSVVWLDLWYKVQKRDFAYIRFWSIGNFKNYNIKTLCYYKIINKFRTILFFYKLLLRR